MFDLQIHPDLVQEDFLLLHKLLFLVPPAFLLTRSLVRHQALNLSPHLLEPLGGNPLEVAARQRGNLDDLDGGRWGR